MSYKMSDNKPILSQYSNKYNNTIELLGKAKVLKDVVEKNNLSLGTLEGRRFNKSYHALSLKEKVLGYLEDLTDGKMHSTQIPKEDMHQYIDWLVADTPETPFPKKEHPSAYARSEWLRSYIENNQDPDKAKKELLRTIYLESSPEMKLNEIENIVWAGGGAKALSLAGVVRSLEERNFTPQIKRVAGTSGGAIIAMAYAVGYNADELEKLIMNNQFGLFTIGSRFDNGIMNQWAHHFTRDTPQSKLHVLSDNSLAHKYHGHLIQAMAIKISKSNDIRFKNLKFAIGTNEKNAGKQLIKILNKSPEKDVYYHSIINTLSEDERIDIDYSAKEKIQESFSAYSLTSGFSLYKSPSQALVYAMRHKTGQDLVRGFFSDVMYEKLKTYPKEYLKYAIYGKQGFDSNKNNIIKQDSLRNFSFTQLQRLHEIMPDKVKELHISMSILRPAMERIKSIIKYDPYEHASASFAHDEFSEMPIADAVRVSMNLPPIYPRYKFEIGKKSYLGSDGGLKSNMSLNTFDGIHAPEKTIGVFYKTSNELKAAVDVNRMLVLPRSKKEIQMDLSMMFILDNEAKESINLIRDNINGLDPKKETDFTKIVGLKNKINQLLETRRSLGGRIAGFRGELDNISGKPNTLKRWAKSPLGELGSEFGKYLDSKSQDELGQSKNLRRLVMINTHEIDTWHFKMPTNSKSEQIEYGKKAMDSLLNGTYCLENHFYHHHFKTVREVLLGHNVGEEIKNVDLGKVGYFQNIDNSIKEKSISEPRDLTKIVVIDNNDNYEREAKPSL